MPRDLPLQKTTRPGARSAAPRQIELTTYAPYWRYVGDEYSDPWRDDDTHWGEVLPDRTWLVLYPADALPQSSDPAWTPAGIATAESVSGSILTVRTNA
jgi:hypothetical protein